MFRPLSISMPSDREIVVTRDFAAPPDLVFDCWTVPALIRRWLGPADWVMTVCEFDARVGGAWRFVSRGPTGFEMGHGGTILELDRPRWIRTTERYDMDWTGGETLNSNAFTPTEAGTRSVLTVLYASKEARDGAAATPMAEGMESGFRRLDTLLAERPDG
ncbi:SRPBCC family protein [Devosia sp.]|uniref:SRPBCC family protein n=1 Tax=Devosia sp. TaxID=1871048 RepID=UPI0035B20061